MATSPIYSWPEPDNTDLVRNGALAIRTLGNAIDTTMGTMTPKSTYTAKGSIAAATAASTPANLAVGNNGEALVSDSSTATGLRYTALFGANKNKFINSDFGIWQRGTSQTTNGYGSADRWDVNTDGTFTNSREPFTAGAAPVAGYEGQYFYRSTRTTGSYMIVQQSIEDVRTFANQTVTLSYWARCSSGTITNSPSAVQYFGSGGSANVDIGCTPSTASVTTTWQRFTHIFVIPSISGKTIGAGSFLQVRALRHVSGTGATIDIWGLQIEAGSVATAFQTATGTIQGELAACQRYYYRNTPGTNYGFQGGLAFALTTTIADTPVNLPVAMRVVPTGLEVSNVAINDGTSFYGSGTWTLPASGNGTQIVTLRYTHGSAVLTAQKIYLNTNNNTPLGYVGLSAEL
jgi:hypothetical protein